MASNKHLVGNDHNSEKSEPKENAASARADRVLHSDVAKTGFEDLNEKQNQVAKERQQIKRKMGVATGIGLASGNDLLGNTYTVKAGDNLSNIARHQLGKNASESEIYKFVKEIAKLNEIKNPNLIHPGDKLILPKDSNHDASGRSKHKEEDTKKPEHHGDNSKGQQEKPDERNQRKNANGDNRENHHEDTRPPDAKALSTKRELPQAKPNLPNVFEWGVGEGNDLARRVAEKASGGLMFLGPMDTMRPNVAGYKDENGYFPVFTHADKDDFHMYYTLHAGRKEYSPETMAAEIKKHIAPGQPIRLLGCESGMDGEGGVAQRLAELLPDHPVYAPNGYCELANGKASVLLKKLSEMPSASLPDGTPGILEPPHGSFVRIYPRKKK